MYSTRLLILLIASTFSYTFYYHTLPFLVYEDTEIPNATNSFGLILENDSYQGKVKSSFYFITGIGSILFCCLSDVLGRKVVLTASIVLSIAFNVFALLSISPLTLMTVHTGMGLNFCTGLVQGYLLLCESIPKTQKKFMTGLLFATWGLSLFLSSFLYKLSIHWKIINLVPLLLSILVYLMLAKYFESPVHLISVGDLETSEAVMTQISMNETNREPSKPIIESLKSFKDYLGYLKDFGSNKGLLVVLWFNLVLVYNSLWNTRIKYTENFFSDSMIAGLLMCSAAVFAAFNERLNFWEVFLGSVVSSRVSVFLLYFIEGNDLPVKFFYAVACIGLVNEAFSLFFITEELVKGRIKSKVFGVLIFIAFGVNFEIKSNFFYRNPSRNQCLLCSLAALSSVFALKCLKNAEVKSSMDLLIPAKSENFEMRTIN